MSMFQRDWTAISDSNFRRATVGDKQYQYDAFDVRDGEGNVRSVTAGAAADVPDTDAITGESFKELAKGQRAIYLFSVGFSATNTKVIRVTESRAVVNTDYSASRFRGATSDNLTDYFNDGGVRFPAVPADSAPFGYMAIYVPENANDEFQFGVDDWDHLTPELQGVGINGRGFPTVMGLPPRVPWSDLVDMA